MNEVSLNTADDLCQEQYNHILLTEAYPVHASQRFGISERRTNVTQEMFNILK